MRQINENEKVYVCNKTLDDDVFDFIYNAAMNDAVMQNAYKGEKQVVLKNDKARIKVREYIDGILFPKENSKKDFYDTADAVISAIGNKEFTFGNAQKLINMTVKYMYIVTYGDKKKRKLFEECHCPMDSIMIPIVKKKFVKLLEKNNQSREIDSQMLEFKDQNGKISKAWSNVYWSKITNGRDEYGPYKKYQAMVKALADEEGINPVEYDFHYWKRV